MFPEPTEDPGLLSPLALAFLGDAVYELLLREKYVKQANRPAGVLHALCAKSACAGAQAQALRQLVKVLTEEETEICKRGRNASPGHKPKGASHADYHAATGIETLFGWLYLKGDIARLRELFELICNEENRAQQKPRIQFYGD